MAEEQQQPTAEALKQRRKREKAAAQMLKCVTTPFVVAEKVSRAFESACRKQLEEDPGEPEDQIIKPHTSPLQSNFPAASAADSNKIVSS